MPGAGACQAAGSWECRALRMEPAPRSLRPRLPVDAVLAELSLAQVISAPSGRQELRRITHPGGGGSRRVAASTRRGGEGRRSLPHGAHSTAAAQRTPRECRAAVGEVARAHLRLQRCAEGASEAVAQVQQRPVAALGLQLLHHLRASAWQERWATRGAAEQKSCCEEDRRTSAAAAAAAQALSVPARRATGAPCSAGRSAQCPAPLLPLHCCWQGGRRWQQLARRPPRRPPPPHRPLLPPRGRRQRLRPPLLLLLPAPAAAACPAAPTA